MSVTSSACKNWYFSDQLAFTHASPSSPMSEDQLLAGELEPTNEWYAIAKIAGLKLCEAHRRQYGNNFISVMPTNPLWPGR
jgi:nucleoside-diphosphate-sugar epimerase